MSRINRTRGRSLLAKWTIAMFALQCVSALFIVFISIATVFLPIRIPTDVGNAIFLVFLAGIVVGILGTAVGSIVMYQRYLLGATQRILDRLPHPERRGSRDE